MTERRDLNRHGVVIPPQTLESLKKSNQWPPVLTPLAYRFCLGQFSNLFHINIIRDVPYSVPKRLPNFLLGPCVLTITHFQEGSSLPLLCCCHLVLVGDALTKGPCTGSLDCHILCGSVITPRPKEIWAPFHRKRFGPLKVLNRA